MMMQKGLVARFVPLLLVLIVAGNSVPIAAVKEKVKSTDKHVAKFGDLSVVATNVASTESTSHKGDRHAVAVFISVKNTGKGVVCASFGASLEATYGLEFVGFGGYLYGAQRFPEAPRMYQMLPGESAEGSYVFDVKDGVEPLALVLKLSDRTIRCGSSESTPWHDVTVPDEVRLDVHDLPPPVASAPQLPAPRGLVGIDFTLPEYNAYQAEHDEPNPQQKIRLLEDFVAQYPSSALLVNVYSDAVLTYYYQLNDYPNTVKYADKVLALADKLDADSQNQIRLIRTNAQQKMQ